MVTKGMSCVLRLSIKPWGLKTFSLTRLTRISKSLMLGPAQGSLVKCWCSKGIGTLTPWTKQRNVYKRYICAALSDVPIDDIQTGEYDVTLCAGTIVYGQAKPVALDECVRHVRPGNTRMSLLTSCH